MSEQTPQESLEDFRDWCQQRGHYASLEAVDRYRTYKATKAKAEKAAQRRAAGCED